MDLCFNKILKPGYQLISNTELAKNPGKLIKKFVSRCRQTLNPDKFTDFSPEELQVITQNFVADCALPVDVFMANVVKLLLDFDETFIFQIVKHKRFGKIMYLLPPTTNVSALDNDKSNFLFYLSLKDILLALKSKLQFDVNCKDQYDRNILMKVIECKEFSKMTSINLTDYINPLVGRNFNFNQRYHNLSLISCCCGDYIQLRSITFQLVKLPQCDITLDFGWLRHILKHATVSLQIINLIDLLSWIRSRQDAPQFFNKLLLGYKFSSAEDDIIDIVNYFCLENLEECKKMIDDTVINSSNVLGYTQLNTLLTNLKN